jgi:2-(1,2-epoxy-1,2-dihydrophenyl)acetyl-CoA isomerase
VLVITGADGEFCAGADLDPSRIDRLQAVEDRHARMKLVGEAALALHRLTKPTIAAVDGVAVGAGMNLALGCDVVVATDRARFSEIFVRRGLTVDFGGSWLLPRIVGLQRAKELALSGRIVEADEAQRLGLVTEVVAPGDLEARVTEVATGLLAGAPLAQMFAKQTLNAAFTIDLADALSWEGEAQSVALGTEDAAEGVLAFLEKRAPDWKGK